ncbi:MAG TPA: OmpA family protein [Planctomycetaceae bacterium]|nr:OmpA family protein [Planctomycetaceae bacterium]
MALCTRMCLWSVVSLLAVAQVGCCCGARRNQYLTQAQLRNQQLWAQNRALSMQRDGFGGNLGQLQQENAALKQNLDLANQRLNNLASSNNQLEQRVQDMLVSANRGNNPLSDDMTRKLEELRQKYPEFEFDPRTGVSKFHTDLLFELGSDQVRPDAMRVLQEFAQIMNHADASHLNVLVVGHTDDKPISKSTTRARHPTNWHLSTDRADSVVLALKKSGIDEKRMGAAGYGMFQPVAPNTNDANRQKNRRVEIFVLAPDAVVAGWDPAAHSTR